MTYTPFKNTLLVLYLPLSKEGSWFYSLFSRYLFKNVFKLETGIFVTMTFRHIEMSE